MQVADFLSKAVDDVKNLPVERGCLQKFEKEIETLTSEHEQEGSGETERNLGESDTILDQPRKLLLHTGNMDLQNMNA